MKKVCKELVVFAHTKISAIMLGGMMMIWSLLALGPDSSLFVRTLNESGYAAQWGVLMMINGVMLLMGSIFPMRSLRHMALAFCCFQMAALGGYFFESGVFTPVSASMPWLSLMSLITLMAEVKGKPRNGCY